MSVPFSKVGGGALFRESQVTSLSPMSRAAPSNLKFSKYTANQQHLSDIESINSESAEDIDSAPDADESKPTPQKSRLLKNKVALKLTEAVPDYDPNFKRKVAFEYMLPEVAEESESGSGQHNFSHHLKLPSDDVKSSISIAMGHAY